MKIENVERFDWTNAEYHADRSSWSHSQLEDLIASPTLFYGRHVEEPPTFPRKESSAFDLGTAVHAALLGDGEDPFVVIPDRVLSKAGRRVGSLWQAFRDEHAGQVLLKPEEAAVPTAMIESVHREPAAMDRLGVTWPGQNETSLRGRDTKTGLLVRARPDRYIVRKEQSALIDVKTTSKFDAFGKQFRDYGYHRQLAWYASLLEPFCFGWPVVEFTLIVVETVVPYRCVVYVIEPEAIALGNHQNRAALDDLARRLEEDDWYEPTHGKVVPLDLPPWAYPDVSLTIGDECANVT